MRAILCWYDNYCTMKTLKLIQSDSYLRPYASAIEGRYNYAIAQEKKLTGGQKLSANMKKPI